MAPHVHEIELGKFENAPAKIELFCKLAQDKWRGTTDSHKSVHDVLNEYRELFDEQFEAYEKFVHLLTELQELRDKVKNAEGPKDRGISAVQSVNIEPQQVAGTGREDDSVSVHVTNGGLEPIKHDGFVPSGETGSTQQQADTLPTIQKENRQDGDKLSSVGIQILESSVVEQASPMEPNSVLDRPTDQQDSIQTRGKLNNVSDQLHEVISEEMRPKDTDGVIVLTGDGPLLVPAVDPITANRVQLPKISTLGVLSPEQLQKLREAGPSPAVKYLESLNAEELQDVRERRERFLIHEKGLQGAKKFQEWKDTNVTEQLPGIKDLLDHSAKQFQEWRDVNVTGSLPGIKDLLDRKRLRDSREVDIDESTKDPASKKSSAGKRPEPSGMPPAKILKRTKTSGNPNSSQSERGPGQAAASPSKQSVTADPKVIEQSTEASLQAQWRERVDALHDILLSMLPTDINDDRTLYNVISTFFWKKNDLISSHKWDTYSEFTCLRRINRHKIETSGSVPMSSNFRTTKCLLCLNEGRKCVKVRSVDGKVEFRTEN